MARRPLLGFLIASIVSTPLWSVPLPAAAEATLDGPVQGGQHQKAFAAPDFDLGKYGYVAEEYFLSGAASAYEMAAGTSMTSDGKWKVERKPEAVPYRTRILIVRPTDPKRFNGSVIVHWQNVTAGYELGSVSEGEYLRGYAWVGVSAQKVGVDGFPGPSAAGLRQWDPERYASLQHPGDAYSYDIFSQAARAVGPRRATQPRDPMGGLPVKRLIAAGASQSAARLRTYINGIHALDRIFDGYLPYIDFGFGIPFAEPPPGAAPTAAAGVAGIRRDRPATRIRSDLGVPVLVLNSETEAEGYVAVRQPDSARFRFWEVAGTSHVSVPRALLERPDAEIRLGFKRSDLDSPNWLSFRPAFESAVRHLHRWLAAGELPPRAPRIQMTAEQPPKIRRDVHGNALGGVRLPELDVPVAVHRGTGANKPGGYRLAFLYGYARDFSAPELAALYPGSAAYLRAYDRALVRAVRSGFVLAEEAPRMRASAEEWAKRLEMSPKPTKPAS